MIITLKTYTVYQLKESVKETTKTSHFFTVKMSNTLTKVYRTYETSSSYSDSNF